MILVVALIGWAAGWVLLWRVPICGEDDRLAETRVSIVIPARNEAGTLPKLLKSIAEQSWRPEQVLVVDDDSTDGTAEAARANGARVISAGELPAGWLGKTWACQQGAAATGKHLLFLDADTWLEPEGLRRMMMFYLQRPGVVSVVPYHFVPSALEQLSAFFNLVMAAGIGAFTLFKEQSVGLFGQMLLIDRDLYRDIGGHEKVRGEVLENLQLAKYLREKGVELRCASGKGCLSVRMYAGGLNELVEGWSKGFASGAGATSKRVRILTICWLIGAVIAASAVVQTRTAVAIGVYVLFVGQLYFMLRRIGSFWFITAVLYPIPLMFFFVVFGRSIARGGQDVTWKGRVIRGG